MSITMRILQQFDVRHEKEFMDLEKLFARLEARRKDYPRGRRMKPVSGTLPCNTLVWECEFPDIQSAKKALSFFEGDSDHEKLFKKQVRFFENVRIEFYENLDY